MDAKFTVRTNEDALKQVNEIIWQMKLLLWAIGSIALIVGWIWIMNIMLVSVTERTREIWIRKAIWATKLNIMFQFLIESIILSMIWCIIAVWLCYFFVYLVNKFWQASNLTATITTSVLIMASVVSIWMWIIFGLMPAWKAARLKPVDALRWE
jgi:putative ABC transport system permease protein